MAKARKEQFEGQLRDLQKDISSLSQRLAIPSVASASRFSARDDPVDHSSSVLEDINKSFVSVGSRTTEKGDKMSNLMQEAHLAKKERDDALYRLEQAKQEIEELRKNLQDSTRLKATYEHLKQDYESVKVSLESSERIRKQQKELINLLQRSHSLAVASDSGSVLSINSISTISHVGNNGHADSRGTDVSSASFAAENREWLKSSATADRGTSKQQSASASNPAPRQSSRTNTTTNPAAAPAPAFVPSASSNAAVSDGRPPTGRTKTAKKAGLNQSSPYNAGPIANVSSTSSSSKARTPVSSSGAKKKPKKKSTTTAPPQPVSNYSEGLSYQQILSQNSSLVPGRSHDLLNTSGYSSTASGHILNHSTGTAGFAGTDVGTYAHTYTVGAASGNPAVPSSSYVPAPILGAQGRPPLHPALQPYGAGAYPVPNVGAPHAHFAAQPYAPYVAVPGFDPRVYYAAAEQPPAVPAGRPATAQPASRTPSPHTTTRRPSSSSGTRTPGTSSAKKSPVFVRRIPSASQEAGSASKTRSKSAPPTRPPTSSFGGAPRKL